MQHQKTLPHTTITGEQRPGGAEQRPRELGEVQVQNGHKGEKRRAGSAAAAANAAVAGSGGTEAAADANSKRRSLGGNSFLRSWAWKREHRPGKVRFDRPYMHPMTLPGGEEVKLTVHQARFKEQGFASTVWDSSIVLAKLFEKHAARFAGRRCLDLSAGCGLPGLALARLGAGQVVATDLAPNLPLLRKNSEANGCNIRVVEHTWGTPVADLGAPFDVIVACDVMYIAELVPPLVASLAALSGPDTEVYISHGRNRQAEPEFLEAARRHFNIEVVSSEELDEVYQCTDVDVIRLRPLSRGNGAAAVAATATIDTADDGASERRPAQARFRAGS